MNYKIIFISFILLFFILGTASANDLNSTDALGDDVKEIYVNTTGDDLNAGTSDSPYATIGKAIGDINASDDATIHIGKGTFSSENDGDFSIDLNHKVYGGNLKFIGSGANETILDGQNSFRFASIGQNSNITFINLSFINFKADNGATLYSEGILTIDNCIFRDSYATGTRGGAIYSRGENTSDLYVINSEFVSCSSNGYSIDNNEYDGGGAIFTRNINYLYLENNTFINPRVNGNLKGFAINIYCGLDNTNRFPFYTKSCIKGNKFINITANDLSIDAGIYISSVLSDYSENIINTNITDNIFINCHNPSEKYSVIYLANGKNLFRNNTFVNSTNTVGNIYIEWRSRITDYNIDIGNETIYIGNSEFNKGLDILINITDDLGNIIEYNGACRVNFISESNNYSFQQYKNEGKVFFQNILENGIYYVTISFLDFTSLVLTNAIVNCSTNPFDLWVSPDGFDGNDGSKDDPLASIQQAIDKGFEKSFNVTVHLMPGVYFGEDNLELGISYKGYLQIIGDEYGEVIIDGENSHWFMLLNCDALIKNLKFINGYGYERILISNSASLREGNILLSRSHNIVLEKCIFESNNVEGGYILCDVDLVDSTFVNNVGNSYMSPNHHVLHSYFANNTCQNGFGSIFYSRGNITIENSIFINNTSKMGGVMFIEADEIISKNNYYESNFADFGGVFYSLDPCFAIHSDNDTYINNHATNYGVYGFNVDTLFSEVNPICEFINSRFINNSAIKAGTIFIQKGTLINCSFINNSANYGGAIVVNGLGTRKYKFESIQFENVTFEGNYAKVNGHDIFLENTMERYSRYINNFIDIKVNFKDLNVSSFYQTLSAEVIGPCESIVGGLDIDFELNGTKIGTNNTVNGIVLFKYYGFENGIYNLNGGNSYVSKYLNISESSILVNITNIIPHREVYVSESNGSDDNIEGNQTNPFKSISKAIIYATNNSRDVIIYIGEGIYNGELNTLLELSSMNNITLVGEGINKTILDGENNTFLATITSGNNKVIFSNLCIRNMLPNNFESQNISDHSVILNNGNLYLEDVLITSCHGGNAIIENNGKLYINNSTIVGNGYAKEAIIFGGDVWINSTIFKDNIAIFSFIKSDSLSISNSEIKDCFHSYDTVYFAPGNPLIYSDFINIDNTLIISSANPSQELLNLQYGSKLVFVPDISIYGKNVYMSNSKMENNYFYQMFNRKTNGFAFGFTESQSSDLNIKVVNSSFANFNYLWMVNTFEDVTREFYGCLFKNLTNIAFSKTIGKHSEYKIQNSTFLDTNLVIDRSGYVDRPNPNINFNNNYWGSNSKPIIAYTDGGNTILNYCPENWVVLNEINGILKLQLTDGKNIADGNDFPLKVAYALSEGEMIPVIETCGNAYQIMFDGENIIVDSNTIENPILKPVGDNTIFTTDLTLTYGDEARFTARFLYPWGDPLANANVAFTINGRNFTALTDENGSISFDVDFDSDVYEVITVNPVSKQVNVNTILVNKIKPKLTAANVNSVYNDGKYLTVNVNAPGTVSVVLNGKTITKTVDSKGQVKIPITLTPKTYTATITYNGNVNYAKASTTATIKVAKATPKLTAKKATFKAKTKKYTITLKDNRNKATKKVKVTLKVGKKTYKATTNAKGKATFKLTKLTKKGKYTAKVKFAGNNKYKAVTKSVKLTVK